MTKLRLGKYKGKSYDWMYKHQPGYCNWLCEQPAGKMLRFFKFIKWVIERRIQEEYQFDSDCSSS